MADDRHPNPSGRPTFIERFGAWLLVFPSVIIGILLVELLCWLFSPLTGNSQTKAMQRVVFLDSNGSIFINHQDIFTYAPNVEMRNLTGFFSVNDFNIEYDYKFRTNNLGLVQDADVRPEQESVLLLGDSFTEGQGAEPWFRLVSEEIDKLGYQGINGGIRGTGFEQWLMLERYLAAKNVRIRKLVVLFISDDYQRPVWNFTPAQLRCLSAMALCRLEESYLYRLPPREELSSWVTKIRATRMPKKVWLVARASALLPASYRLYKYFRDRSQNQMSIARSESAEQQSRTAIATLIGRYGTHNVTFIHVPQKDEVDGPNDIGRKARQAIEEADGKLFDGFKLCRLTASDYYSNDDHPNSAGYEKIAVCVNNVLKGVIAGAQ